MKSKTFRFNDHDEAKFSEVKKRLGLNSDIEVIRFLLILEGFKMVPPKGYGQETTQEPEQPEDTKTVGDPKKIPSWYVPAKKQ